MYTVIPKYLDGQMTRELVVYEEPADEAPEHGHFFK